MYSNIYPYKTQKTNASKKVLLMKKIYISIINLFIIFLLTLCTLILPPVTKTAKAESNLTIPNGSFEQQAVNKNLPSDWSFNYSLYFSYPSTTSISGKSIKLNKGSNSLLTITSKSFSILGGKTYDFSFYCLAENSDTTASITIQPYDNGGFKKDKLEQTFSVSKSTWQRLSFETYLDQEVTQVQIIISINVKSTDCYIDEVGVNEVVNLPDLKLTTLSGASLRLIKDSAGIRFRGTVDKTAYDEYCDKFENVSAGILFTVKENLDGIADFTVQELSNKCRVYKCITAEKWNNGKTLQTDNFYGFNCAIVNVKDVNINKYYCARSYVKFDRNGATEYVYGNFSPAENSRSVKDLALTAMQDLDSYAPEQITIIEYFANHTN